MSIKKRFPFFMRIALAFLLLAALVCYRQIHQFANSPVLITQKTLFTLPPRTGRLALKEQLVNQGVIKDTYWFAPLLQLEPALAKFKAGTYCVEQNMTIRQLLALFVSGKEAQFVSRLIEGRRLQSWLEELRLAPYLRHTLKDDSLDEVAAELNLDPREREGWFYPDTYFYTASTPDTAILRRAHATMVSVVDDIWKNRWPDLPYKDKYELVTMASIIEKETALPEERARVASVFTNRLRAGMRLQTDPTVIYGMAGNYRGNLTRKDLATPGSYNTYLIPGLPPGPIAAPSRSSLEAAAHPEKTDYLYFVADGKGGHVFSVTLEEHNRAVRAYRLAGKEKNGR